MITYYYIYVEFMEGTIRSLSLVLTCNVRYKCPFSRHCSTTEILQRHWFINSNDTESLTQQQMYLLYSVALSETNKTLHCHSRQTCVRVLSIQEIIFQFYNYKYQVTSFRINLLFSMGTTGGLTVNATQKNIFTELIKK